MKVAVLSDIHGNYTAFQTCVDYALAQDIRIFFFLGDYVAEFPYPQRTMGMLYDMQDKYECYFIRGNKEDYWLNRKIDPDCIWKDGNHTVGAMKYTYENQTERDLEFYKTLPICREVALEGAAPIMLMHGSTERNNQKMLPDDGETRRIMEECACKYILCGHTHGQMTIEHAGKVLWNPGAVGVPKYSGGKTQFMILHQRDMEWEPEFVSLEYDKEQILKELQECGLEQMAPYWTQITRHLLQTGEVTHANSLSYAMQMDMDENGSSNWYNVPDKYWIKTIIERVAGKEITLGQSGAHVYELDDARVLKVAFRDEVQDERIWDSYVKEALFYEKCKAEFLPEIYVNIHTENEIFLILEKCVPLERENLDEELLQKIMDVLVQIHAMEIPLFIKAEERKPVTFTEEEIQESLQGWKSVLNEHSGVWKEDTLEEIAACINNINQKFLAKEYSFSHGDFHFENILQDVQGNIKVVDWQNCGAGHVSGDISFFLSRLSSEGYGIDAQEVIERYCKSADKRGGSMQPAEIEIQMCLANLNTSFRFWHQYLHGSTVERVAGIYEKMLADAKTLMEWHDEGLSIV